MTYSINTLVKDSISQVQGKIISEPFKLAGSLSDYQAVELRNIYQGYVDNVVSRCNNKQNIHISVIVACCDTLDEIKGE